MTKQRSRPTPAGVAAPVNPGRRAFAVIALAALALVLAGCYPYPPPTKVPFPDDPRVLHGTWELTVTGLFDDIETFALDKQAQNLVIWHHSSPPLAFSADGTGDYLEADASSFVGANNGTYDEGLDAVVSLVRSGSSLSVKVAPLSGSAASEVTIPVPNGMDLIATAAGAGRAFLVLEDLSGARELRWWDSLTGAVGGTLALPRISDNVHVSRGGRAILLWDLNGWRVNVIDTAAPNELQAVSLGACRSNAFGEVSSDRRWLVVADCSDNLRLVDLNSTAGASSLGLKLGAGMTFAVDSPELVWVDTSGVVRSLDVETRAREELFALEAGEVSSIDLEWPWWHTPLVLNRTQEVLALAKGDGSVTLVGLGESMPTVALPSTAFAGATLELQAVFGDALAERYSSYAFSGTTEISGAPLQVVGEAVSHGLHEYVPGSAGIGPQAAPPPMTHGWADLTAAGEESPAYQLTFSTMDRLATEFDGDLVSGDGAEQYTVVLQRVGQ